MSVLPLLLLAGCQNAESEGFGAYSELEGGSVVVVPPDERGPVTDLPVIRPLAPTDDDIPREVATSVDPLSQDTVSPIANSAAGDPSENVVHAKSTIETLVMPADSDNASSADAQTNLDLPSAKPPAELAPNPIKLLIPENSFRKEGPEGALRITYDDIDLLKILNMDPVPVDPESHFPKWLADLDGARIRVRGFMFPTFIEEGIKNFVLARDNDVCCFVRQPKIYDIVSVKMREGETSRYIEGYPFDVIGTFRVEPIADDGELYQLYHIDDATIIDKRRRR